MEFLDTMDDESVITFAIIAFTIGIALIVWLSSLMVKIAKEQNDKDKKKGTLTRTIDTIDTINTVNEIQKQEEEKQGIDWDWD